MRPIRASEIGSYLYCARAWWYQQKGVQSSNQAEMTSGTELHRRHGRQVLASSLTRALALILLLVALAPRVRVNCVTPGITLTPMGQDTIDALDPDYANNKMLLQRFATPEEIARVIVFVASPANSFMTGATVDVNGGRDLR